MSNPQKTWFVTGSSRGLGRAIVDGVLRRGDRVVATARRTSELSDLVGLYGDRVHLARLDVTDSAEAHEAVARAVKRFGRIDVVVNNAGYGILGAFEEQTPEQFAGQIDTNFWGTVHVCRAVLPVLRQQRSGHIMNITSVGGRRGAAGLSGYQAAKFAVEGFSEVLAQEVAAIGVKLTIVEPGGFRTDWAGASMKFAAPMPEYEPVIKPFADFIKGFTGKEPGDPAKAATVLLDVSRMANPPLRLVLGKLASEFLKEGYEHSLAELQRWRDLSLATEHDGAQDVVLP
jgi:NAD(P)-dependent dehydrogenase (short-subunit alcohol dehydrogenase family)